MEIVVPFDIKNFIEQEISRSIRRQIVPLIRTAYELVDLALEDVSFFQWALGKNHIGYLDNIAVQYTIYEAIKTGKLINLNAEVMPNVNRSSYHVEVKTTNTVLTINRVKSKNNTARSAKYRNILQKENQLYWNMDTQELREEPGYLQLTHNSVDRKLDFVMLGVPDGKGKWISCIDLVKEPHLITKSEDGNNITKEQLVRFKNFAQGVQENGGKNQ